MNNTFKLWFKKDLWSEFTSLHYDKNINIDSLFELSNSKNLYNNIHHNNYLEFNCITVFNDIKNIIKNNLNSQLSDWEKLKPQIDKIEIESLSSFTPDTILEEVINYEYGSSEFLLKQSGIKNLKNVSTDIRININNNKKERRKDNSRMDDEELLFEKECLKDINDAKDYDLLNKRVEDFINEGFENELKNLKESISELNIKKKANPKEKEIDYSVNMKENINGATTNKTYNIPKLSYENNKFRYINTAEKEIYVQSYDKLHDRLFDNTNKEDDLKDSESVRDFMYKEINIEDDDVIITDEEIRLVKETIEQKKMTTEDKDIKF